LKDWEEVVMAWLEKSELQAHAALVLARSHLAAEWGSAAERLFPEGQPAKFVAPPEEQSAVFVARPAEPAGFGC